MSGTTDAYGQRVCAVLRGQFGQRRNACKELGRLIGAAPRTVENWLDGSAAPSGAHLIRLMANCDAIADAVMEMVAQVKESSE